MLSAETKRKFQTALEYLLKYKYRPEEIAIKLKCSYFTVIFWRQGRRTPSHNAVKRFESTFGVKIL